MAHELRCTLAELAHGSRCRLQSTAVEGLHRIDDENLGSGRLEPPEHGLDLRLGEELDRCLRDT